MRKNYFKLAAVALLSMAAAQSAQAIDFPYAQAPADGQRYILASRSNPTNFWTRTSWDGAYYLLPLNDAKNNLGVFTAHQADEGQWYFTVENGEEGIAYGGVTYTGTTYVGFPGGTDNLNGTLYDPALWSVEASEQSGFYLLKAGEGQVNDFTIGGYLHLNNGNQYVVITEPSNYWFPDFYGGIQRDENDEPVYDETGFVVPQNPVSRLWAFINPDDVEPYSVKIELYALLQDIEDNYLPLTDYAPGFQGLLDFALPLYGKEDFTADDLATAKVVADAKLALYREIQNAISLYLDGGAGSVRFGTAIDEATTVFNSTNDVAQLEAALQALKNAESEYAQGTGDLTALLTNPSFEDLSSQGGSQTTGVAAPPTGWNVYVKGQRVTTAAEVSAAGIANWHGINNDAEGALDGQLAFGLWTGGVPEYEISQTLTGLENGTYMVQAALMVGANGNGSRRTTQRIFGNLNATYFGGQGEYDLSRLDQSEVYDFQGLNEPVTDRELQEMQVRAYVYDGTLTVGLRTNGDIAAANRTEGNSAGGDGWFKLDNFRVEKLGYVESDALLVYQHFSQLYGDLLSQKMQQSIKDRLTQLIGGGIGTGSSQEEINNAIVELRDMYGEVTASVDAYARLLEAYKKGQAALDEYFGPDIDEFEDLLFEVDDIYFAATASVEEINELIARIEAGIDELKASSITIGDVTYAVKNPGFEDLSAQNNSVSDGAQPAPFGWTLTAGGAVVQTVGGGWCAINRGDAIDVYDDEGNYWDHQYTEGEYLWGIWNSNIPEVELSQTLSHMPKGTYTLEADVMVQYNWAGDNLTTQRIFGNNSVQMFGTEEAHEVNLPEDARQAATLTYAGYDCMEGDPTTSLLRPMKVVFGVGADGVAKIGFRTNGINRDGLTFAEGGRNGQGWFKVDNFRLSYDSEDVPSSVESIAERAATAAVGFYTLDGRRLQAPQRGLNIVKTAGKATKVFVK